MFVANRIVIAGLGFLALAMCGSLLLVATKLFGASRVRSRSSSGALPFAVLWFAMPLRRRYVLEARNTRAPRSSERRR